MNRTLIRVVACLLIPALLVDPALAFSPIVGAKRPVQASFNSQALTLVLCASLFVGAAGQRFVVPEKLSGYTRSLGAKKRRKDSDSPMSIGKAIEVLRAHLRDQVTWSQRVL